MDDGTSATGDTLLLEYEAPGNANCGASIVLDVEDPGGVEVTSPAFADRTPGTMSMSDGFPVVTWHPTDDRAQFYQMTDELLGGTIEISVWTADRIELLVAGGMHCPVDSASTVPCVPANGVITFIGPRGAPIAGENTPGMYIDAATGQLLCDAEDP